MPARCGGSSSGPRVAAVIQADKWNLNNLCDAAFDAYGRQLGIAGVPVERFGKVARRPFFQGYVTIPFAIADKPKNNCASLAGPFHLGVIPDRTDRFAGQTRPPP